MSTAPLIFLDIDGALLDARYMSNDPDLTLYITQLQTEKEYVFGLNSNRSLEDILPIAKAFAIVFFTERTPAQL